MTEKHIHDGSIQFKYDGEGFWCASATFKGEDKKILIGSILIGVIHENKEIKAAFMDLMRKTLEHMVSSTDPNSEVVFLDKTEEPSKNQ